MSDSLDLSLRYAYNGRSHNDIVMSLGGQSWVCDSYYFALDTQLLPDHENADKVQAVLRRLLEQWLVAVERLRDGGKAYLPYDYSDEYTGWLECLRSGGEVAVSRGWALVEGWSIYPSMVGDYSESPQGFRIDGPTVRCNVSELVDAIRASLAEVF